MGFNSIIVFVAWSAMAGISVPVMASMTGTLGRSLASPAYGALVAVLIGLAGVIVTLLAIRAPAPSGGAFASVPAWAYAGGLGMAFYALSAAFVTPRFGVGNFVICVVLAQLVMSSVIDQFGLFGAPVNPMSLRRVVGLVLLGGGAALVALK
ncbi:MAG: DMT family transporter [Hyphomonadaceae bacterium]